MGCVTQNINGRNYAVCVPQEDGTYNGKEAWAQARETDVQDGFVLDVEPISIRVGYENAHARKFYGVRLGAYVAGDKIDTGGVEIGVVNTGTRSVDGVQFGIYNGAGGGINGVQLGLINYVNEESNGVQLSLVNWADKNINGVQLAGLFNVADGQWNIIGEKGTGVSIGAASTALCVVGIAWETMLGVTLYLADKVFPKVKDTPDGGSCEPFCY